MNALPESDELVDHTRPWLGLASFSEQTRAYFHGRDGEVAELARRVQRKLLTVLFGQSGLGKTSILKAGIVPRLRALGYCPVYVRIDYAATAPSPGEQVRRAIHQAAPLSGFDADEGQSLWELLHRRDLVLKDADGQTVIALLIVDQFEEMFTLAQGDDAGRTKAAEFMEELAGLVENRPPCAVEQRLEEDDTLIDTFDFGREDYRVLIALREDYLAHLEQLKKTVPSITQNRMRLAPMTGSQALAAVTGPGGRLVNEEVAAAIVRFVANGAEIAHAQVEPSLLSLICRELNDARIAAGRSDISLDLLAGSHASILSDFYERALAGHPAAVRNVVEDVLLTGSGYRENVAEERVLQALAQAGAAPGTLADLVNRRLLRIEERLDIRRVELTHDVLCSVVRTSRDQRRERELLDEGERALAQRKLREETAHRSLVRTRQVAVACVTLAVAALGASGYAYYATERAKAAIVSARQIQSGSDQARRQAEQLTAYLLDDFARELGGSSKQQMFVDLGKRVQQYYDALPDIAPNSDTELYRALAQLTYGNALIEQSKLAQAGPVIASALATFKHRQAAGLHSDQDNVALARALMAQSGYLGYTGHGDEAVKEIHRALAVIEPAMARPSPSVQVRRTYAEAKMHSGFSFLPDGHWNAAIAPLRAARTVLLGLGAKEVSDVSATLSYIDAGNGLARALLEDGGIDEVIDVTHESIALADKVLALRPQDVTALAARAVANYYAARIHSIGGAYAKAVALAQASLDDNRRHLQLDPGAASHTSAVIIAIQFKATMLGGLGKYDDALRELAQADALARSFGDGNVGVDDSRIKVYFALSTLNLQLGHLPAAEAAQKEAERIYAAAFRSSKHDMADRYFLAGTVRRRAYLTLNAGKAAEAAAIASHALEHIRRGDAGLTDVPGGIVIEPLAEAWLALGQAQQAHDLLRATAAGPASDQARSPFTQRQVAGLGLLDARALVLLGRRAEARQALLPLFAKYQAEQQRHSDRALLPFDLAAVHVVQASASDGPQRMAALAQARAQLALLPAAAANLTEVRRLRQQIEAIAHEGRGHA